MESSAREELLVEKLLRLLMQSSAHGELCSWRAARGRAARGEVCSGCSWRALAFPILPCVSLHLDFLFCVLNTFHTDLCVFVYFPPKNIFFFICDAHIMHMHMHIVHMHIFGDLFLNQWFQFVIPVNHVNYLSCSRNIALIIYPCNA